ncbi:hypothetical protein [Roseovarius sp. THAF9]|uniref:hypothetical protein n=1 Tax=Roseovarius sp. THAF9 TaxID=2587847 RepID=UPI0012690534|nr:hypothetical protein [Roseovarius sp. THAF9]
MNSRDEHSASQNFLVEAVIASRRGRDEALRAEFQSDHLASAAQKVLDHPYLLPLAEIMINGATSLRGARLSVEQFAVATKEVFLDTPLFFRCPIEVLEITHITKNEFAEKVKDSQNADVWPLFETAITQYLCIDDGNGFCVTERVLRQAVLMEDFETLSRIVAPTSGSSPFSEEARLNLSRNTSGQTGCFIPSPPGSFRRAQIVDLTKL